MYQSVLLENPQIYNQQQHRMHLFVSVRPFSYDFSYFLLTLGLAYASVPTFFHLFGVCVCAKHFITIKSKLIQWITHKITTATTYK